MDLFESAGGGGGAILEGDPAGLGIDHAANEQAAEPKGSIVFATGDGLSTKVLRFDNVRVITEGVVRAGPDTVKESLRLEAASRAFDEGGVLSSSRGTPHVASIF